MKLKAKSNGLLPRSLNGSLVSMEDDGDDEVSELGMDITTKKLLRDLLLLVVY